MPTKLEILKSNDVYSNIDEGAPFIKLEKSLDASLEEYAKQEALEFISFNREHGFKYMGWYYADVWNEYQKSKII